MRELRIDTVKVERKLKRFIRKQTEVRGLAKLVVGLSGGLDSSLTVYLCCRALGNENVFALILPYKTTSSDSINYAKVVARKYQVRTKFINITPQIDEYFKNFPEADKIRRGNKMARERMSILYDQSKELDALVVGTSNKTEILLGYGTIYGDTACAFNPIGGLYKTQLRQLAKDIGLPDGIVRAVPSAGLWPGQTDEAELGLSYNKADKLLYYLVEQEYSDNRLYKLGFKKSLVEKVRRRIAENRFKTCMPPIARIK